jgi:hypothetical protein
MYPTFHQCQLLSRVSLEGKQIFTSIPRSLQAAHEADTTFRRLPLMKSLERFKNFLFYTRRGMATRMTRP